MRRTVWEFLFVTATLSLIVLCCFGVSLLPSHH